MDDVVATTGFTGAVLVGWAGEPAFEGGWGMANHDAGMRFTPDTPVDGASLAKTFVAAGVWRTVARGDLDLDDPVVDHVPEVRAPGLTLRHLLEHSAGLVELDGYTGLDNVDVAAALDSAVLFEAGHRFAYCNECFDVLALATERVTGRPWPEFVRDEFFEPLGMDSSFVRPARLADWGGPRARGYRLAGAELRDLDIEDDERFYGSSNLFFSARDLFRWGSALAAGEVLPEAWRVRASTRAGFTSGERSALNRLNWYQPAPDGPAYFDGHLAGFHSVVYWDPATEVVVVWVSNTLGGRPVEHELTRALVEGASRPDSASAEWSPTFPGRGSASDSGGARIDGRYDVPGVGIVSIAERGGIAAVRVGGGPEHDGYPSTGFYIPDFGVEIGFSDPDDGRYERLHWLGVFHRATGTRVADPEPPAPGPAGLIP